VVLTYDTERELAVQISLSGAPGAYPPEQAVRVGMVGAGNFTQATLLPAMQQVAGLQLVGIVSGSGLNARTSGERYGFAYAASEIEALLTDQQINWLVITTRHNLHAQQAVAGMQAGKDVFVEKPLALNRDELAAIVGMQRRTGRRLIVGFNRRFAPLVQDMHAFLKDHSRPLLSIYRINAGAIPATHWTQSAEEGGGRIIGEACHFIDLLQYLTGAPPVMVYASAAKTGHGLVEDEAIITLHFADGSVGTVVYAAGGDRAFSKERIEVIGDGKVAVLDDFHTLDLIQNGKRTRARQRLRTSKGHREQWQGLVRAVQAGQDSTIAMDEIVTTHLATYAAVESMSAGRPIPVDRAAFYGELEESPEE
jgi:predicted dehydrogenase